MNRIAPLILFGLLAIALAFSLSRKSGEPIPVSGKVSVLPPLTLAPLDTPNTPVSFTPRAGKITLINFFASWCVPCLAEHEEMKKLGTNHRLAIEGVAWNDTPENIRGWLAEHGNPYGRVWIDPGSTAAISLGLRGVPESFLIDGQGKVRLHLQGALTEDTRKALLLLVPQMQAEMIDVR